MKYYLLIAGDQYYPSASTGDWIDTFETFEEAKSMVIIAWSYGLNKDIFYINGLKYDWYEIVNLREWIEK